MQPGVSIRPPVPGAAKRAAPAVALRLLAMAALLAVLGGCASRVPTPPPQAPPSARPPTATLPPAGEGEAGGIYVGGTVQLECAPFARAVSGIDLRGAAGDWWERASGRYARGSRPAVGAVLAFRRTARLPDGHAAVVSRVVNARTILVTQANWVAHRVTQDMPVMDVSPANDWSAVRVWWPPSGQMGSRHYPTWGFILADRPLTREGLAASAREAIRVASSE